jgi:hypothetical protein
VDPDPGGPKTCGSGGSGSGSGTQFSILNNTKWSTTMKISPAKKANSLQFYLSYYTGKQQHDNTGEVTLRV